MTVLREAYVLVVPDLDNFDDALRRGLRRINVDREGRRVGERMGDSLNRGFMSKGNVFTKVAAVMASRMALIGAAGAAATPGVVALTAALVPAAGAAAALPVALAGIAAAAGTLKVATAGVGDAIKTGFTGSSKQAAEAMAKLPPEAQKFARTITGLKAPLSDLRASVSNRFFGPFNDEVQGLATKYIPMLKTGMGGIAGQLGGLSEEFVTAATKGSLFGGVQAVMANTATGLGRLRGSVAPLANAFGDAFKATAPLLVSMGDSVGNLADRFSAWLSGAAKSGALVDMIRQGVAVFKQLGTILANVGSILSSVFSAAQAGGGNLLTIIGNLTGQFAAFLKSAEGQAALTAAFKALAAVGATLGSTLGVVLPMIGQALQAIGPVIPPLVAVVGEFVKALAPIIPVVAQLAAQVGGVLTQALGALVRVFGPLITMVVTFAGQILGGLMPVLGPLVQLVAQVAAVVGQSLMAAFVALQPGLMAIVNALVGLLPVLMPLIMSVVQLSTAFTPLLPAVAALATTIVTTLLPILVPLIETLAKVATTILQWLIPPIQRLISVIAGSLGPTFKALWSVVTTVWNGIRAAIGAVVAWFSGTIAPNIRSIGSGISSAFGTMKNLVVNAWNGIKSPIESVWSFLRDKIFNPIKTFVTETIPNAFTTGVNSIKAAWEKIKEAARAPVAFVVNYVINPLIRGYNLIADLIPGIDPIKEITGFARGGMIPGSPSNKDNRLALAPAGLLKVASGEFITNTRSTRANLPLLKAINDAHGPLRGSVDPFADGINERLRPNKTGQGGITDFFKGVWNGLKGIAGFVMNPKEQLLKMGRDLIGKIPGDGMIGKMLRGMGNKVLNGIANWVDDKAGAGEIGENGMSGGWRAMQAVIKKAFPHLSLTSGYRPGSRTLSGNQSYHALGRAVDYPADRALAMWIKRVYGGKTKELITPWHDVNLYHGRPHTYTGAVWNQHNFAGGNAHVHWAAAMGGLVNKLSGMPFGSYDSGGFLPPGLSLAHNGTGRPEPVGMAAAGGITVNVTVPVGAHPAEVGRVIVEHIKAYEAGSGARWRR